jgi:hypothetical protein
VDPVAFAVHYLPAEATFAGYPTYNHPLLICGCKMAEGYAGHLFSHGIDYEGRDEALKMMMMGAPEWQAIADGLHVRYLYWGHREEEAYPGSRQPWKVMPVVAAGDWGTIYEVAGAGK